VDDLVQALGLQGIDKSLFRAPVRSWMAWSQRFVTGR